MLFLLHLPGPKNGSTLIGEFIKNHYLENKNNIFININLSASSSEIGKFRFYKIKRLTYLFWNLIRVLCLGKVEKVYFSLSLSGNALVKDILILLLIKVFNSSKILFHFHNKRKFRGSILERIARYLTKGQKGIVLSKSLQNEYEYLRLTEIQICPNPILQQRDKSIERAKISKYLRILVCSHLYTFKGIKDLFEIAQEFKMRYGPHFQINVVGEDGDLSRHKLMSITDNRGLAENLIFHGGLYGENKYRLYANSDIFLHPTYDDCFPLVLLEAIEYEIPIVSTSVGGIPDIVVDKGSGYVCNSGDISNITISLLKLSEKSERMRMKTYIKENIKHKYSDVQFKKKLDSIINEL